MKEWTGTFSDFALGCVCLLCWRTCVQQAGKEILAGSDKTLVFPYFRIWKTERFILCEDFFTSPYRLSKDWSRLTAVSWFFGGIGGELAKR